MRVLIQRVKQASVTVQDEVIASIDQGMLIFLGIHKDDTPKNISWLVQKCLHLRFFSDEQDKMNLSIKDINGQALIVSQFTLYGNCHSGRRPEFTKSMKGPLAEEIYNQFVEEMQLELPQVHQGSFGAKMDIMLINDGPVTFIIDTKNS